jgi:hypothetical protein
MRAHTTSNMAYCETPQKQVCTKNTSAIHVTIFYPIYRYDIIAVCLQNQFTRHELCDHDHKLQVDAGVHALLATHEGKALKFRPSDVTKYNSPWIILHLNILLILSSLYQLKCGNLLTRIADLFVLLMSLIVYHTRGWIFLHSINTSTGWHHRLWNKSSTIT